ncbi:MAG: hypothetical protein AAB459_03955 [Patescibacteria group bacterium]
MEFNPSELDVFDDSLSHYSSEAFNSLTPEQKIMTLALGTNFTGIAATMRLEEILDVLDGAEPTNWQGVY